MMIGRSKLLQLILRVTWIFVPNIMEIHPITVDIFHFKTKCQGIHPVFSWHFHLILTWKIVSQRRKVHQKFKTRLLTFCPYPSAKPTEWWNITRQLTHVCHLGPLSQFWWGWLSNACNVCWANNGRKFIWMFLTKYVIRFKSSTQSHTKKKIMYRYQRFMHR